MSEHYNLEYGQYPKTNDLCIPQILPVYEVDLPERWIEFDYAHRNRSKRDKTGIHFFERDYKFNRVWETPTKYLQLLQDYALVLSPDFSMYADYPLVMQMWNLYRNCWCARFWQDNGITVIPTVMWGDKDSYDWCFQGMPKHSIVATSTVGNMKSDADKEYFLSGYNAMLERLEPKEVLVMSRDFHHDLQGPVHWIQWCLKKSDQAI